MHGHRVGRVCGVALGLAGVAAVVAAAGQGSAQAHAIESSLERVSGLTDALLLQSRFSANQPASHAEVRLVAPDGTTLALGRTDAQGSLQFQVPKGAGAGWEVQVDQGPGHRDYLELPAASDNGSQQPASQANRPSLVERTWWDARNALQQPQPLALAGLVALGGLGGAALWRRQRRAPAP